ncbi:16S rRNA (guanine(527)-N(7))-methyltransferase RsmG [Puniceibacterium sp. IMCC21224]|uniref:16S rRNA (guanine(527)-N(7))-methyltransferase RsmG n=1 Tax=Puniceibacterium sp. IMCC21224 TaxID=1618204 RepID=UPI00064DA45A|nr:16S rRNA (guanine(527)-N(7))-methyltransferase RsmG [Puniceibacterium sp. IMCC21224]KMK65413.1 16S rRNA m(7)G-527 methyltransferase [Puniceibacterium sp. IMCC21224]
MTQSFRHEVLQDVSRETMEQLDVYAEVLKKWNRRINLVSPASMEHLWTRHIADSVQIYDLAPSDFTHWADLGSGGGFPGLVVAILAQSRNPTAKITLVESDARKAAFLRAVLRETGALAAVVNDRIERLPPLNASVISARALSDLSDLLAFADLHMAQGGAALFPKGERWKKELAPARDRWSFSLESHTSKTDPFAVILQIGALTHV